MIRPLPVAANWLDTKHQPKSRFPLGQVVVTRTFAASGLNPYALLARHMVGDWGDLGWEDKHTNEEALKTGERLFSSYKVGIHKVWVITESDRSVTTVLFPEDY